jgi:hypothetical protein
VLRGKSRGRTADKRSRGPDRLHEPGLAEDELLTLIAENTGIPIRLIRVAVRYWASYPDEVDAEIAAAEAADGAAEDAWRRERQLLAG